MKLANEALAPDGAGRQVRSAARKKTKRTKKSKTNGKPDRNVRVLFDHYALEYEATRKTKPRFAGSTGGRAAKAFKDLLIAVDVETAKAAISRALHDEFTKRIQPWQLVEDLNRHLAEGPRGRKGRRAQPQEPNGLAAVEARKARLRAVTRRAS